MKVRDVPCVDGALSQEVLRSQGEPSRKSGDQKPRRSGARKINRSLVRGELRHQESP